MSQITLTQINNGDVNDAVPVMSNFNAVKNRINLGMESDNIAAGAVNGSHINLGAYIFKQSKGADVASASSISLGNDGNFFDITGTTNITSITAKTAGTVVQLQFDSSLTVVNGSNLKLGADFIATTNSLLQLVSDGTNWYRCDTPFVPTSLNALTGSVVQVVNTQTGTFATGTTSIPLDNTIPQNTEGTEFMTLAITPNSASNKLKITVVISGGSTSSDDCIAALFQDSTANALACGIYTNNSGGNEQSFISFIHYMTAGTTSSTTFKVRAGAQGGTFCFNGGNGSARFGGVLASSITIEEIKV